MEWWMWLVLGLALLGGEMLLPSGFFMLFFGFGALAVGVLVLLNLGGPIWVQWVLFSVASIVMLILLRQKMRMLLGTAADAEIDSMVGEIAVTQENLAPGAIGQVELRGTVWKGRNGSDAIIPQGQRCVVSAVEGLTVVLKVEK